MEIKILIICEEYQGNGYEGIEAKVTKEVEVYPVLEIMETKIENK